MSAWAPSSALGGVPSAHSAVVTGMPLAARNCAPETPVHIQGVDGDARRLWPFGRLRRPSAWTLPGPGRSGKVASQVHLPLLSREMWRAMRAWGTGGALTHTAGCGGVLPAPPAPPSGSGDLPHHEPTRHDEDVHDVGGVRDVEGVHVVVGVDRPRRRR